MGLIAFEQTLLTRSVFYCFSVICAGWIVCELGWCRDFFVSYNFLTEKWRYIWKYDWLLVSLPFSYRLVALFSFFILEWELNLLHLSRCNGSICVAIDFILIFFLMCRSVLQLVHQQGLSRFYLGCFIIKSLVWQIFFFLLRGRLLLLKYQMS